MRKTETTLLKTPSGELAANNCFIFCLWKRIGGSYDELYHKIYYHLNKLSGTDFVDFDIIKICDFLEIQIELYYPEKLPKKDAMSFQYKSTISKKFIGKTGERIKLLRINNHYDLILDASFLEKALCAICGHWINLGESKHWDICIQCPKCFEQTTKNSEHIRMCVGKKRKFAALGKSKDTDAKKEFLGHFELIKTYTLSKDDITFKHNVHFADFECFCPIGDTTRNFTVYAAAIVSINADMPFDKIEEPFRTYRCFYGKKALEQFMHYIKKLKGVIYFWNGASFDAFFMIRYMLKNQWKMYSDKMVINNNRIITFNISKELVIRDLMLYIAPVSLKNACAGFGVSDEYSKGDFDHSKINSWKDVSTYKVDVQKYLRNDVLSMLFIYKDYAIEIYKVFGANVTSAMTLSHLSYMIWSDMLNKQTPWIRMYKLSMDEYQKIIPGYYGGRVILQQQVWQSIDYDEVMQEADKNNGWVSTDTFNRVNSYLCKLDVVSLYPSVMENNFFPVGKWEFLEISDDQQSRWFFILNSLHNEISHRRYIVCVDVTCPKDIYVPFLMSRDEKGKLEQNLHDKVKQIYYAPELVHALRLGYKLTRVHWVMDFESSAQVFKSYIAKFWQMKSVAKKGTAKYQTAKGTGNALSGKFGQIEHMISSKIASMDEFNEFLETISGYELIREGDDIIGVLYNERNDKDFTSYPSYLSLCILAYSRIAMSKTMFQIDGYRNSDTTPLYGDTDSLIVPNSTLANIPNLGKNLGNIDDELDGGKIIKFVGLAPKTYNTLYLSSKIVNGRHELLSSTRCKGIPHSSESVNLYKPITDKSIKLNEVLSFIEEPDEGELLPIAMCGLNDVLYSIEESGKVRYISHIGHVELMAILNKDAMIKVYYRTIRKTLKQNGHKTSVSVSTGLSVRQVYATDWWGKNDRRNKPIDLFTLSTPVGFNK